MPSEDKRKDHFVARTYLRRFSTNDNLYVFSKKNNKFIEPKTKSICCQIGWDILQADGYKYALRNLLQQIEPFLNNALNRITHNVFQIDDRIIISHYLAILGTLNPSFLAKMKHDKERIIQQPLLMLIECGKIKVPDEMKTKIGNKNPFKIKIDDNHLKTELIQPLLEYIPLIYRSPWIILKNTSDKDYITSDNPFQFMACPHNAPVYPRFIALDPKHILLMLPPFDIGNKLQYNKTFFTHQNAGSLKILETQETDLFNIYTISNATQFIILGKRNSALKEFVINNKNIKTENKVSEFGSIFFSRLCCNRSI